MVNRNFLDGLFVVAGIALFTVGLFLIGNRHEAFAQHIDYYAEFKNLAGLSKGSKVQVAGMDAGQVLEIGVPESPSSRFESSCRSTIGCVGLYVPIRLRQSEPKES
jgi:phospholipid/cholesterol/gamma-HCH transport system substrate-binding protein